MRFCKCGCKQLTNMRHGKYNKYIIGHTRQGIKHTKQTKRLMSKSHSDYWTPEHRREQSVRKCNISEETKHKMSIAKKGKLFTETHKKHMTKKYKKKMKKC